MHLKFLLLLNKVNVTPKRVKTTRVRSENNPIFGVILTPDWELKELLFRRKNDPKFGVKVTHKRSYPVPTFLFHFWSYNNSLKITV